MNQPYFSSFSWHHFTWCKYEAINNFLRTRTHLHLYNLFQLVHPRRTGCDDKLTASKCLHIVVRQHKWQFAVQLAKYSTKSFVAEVVEGANEYMNWYEDPEFGTRVVRCIISRSCPSHLRSQVTDGLEQCGTEGFYYDLADMGQVYYTTFNSAPTYVTCMPSHVHL